MFDRATVALYLKIYSHKNTGILSSFHNIGRYTNSTINKPKSYYQHFYRNYYLISVIAKPHHLASVLRMWCLRASISIYIRLQLYVFKL